MENTAPGRVIVCHGAGSTPAVAQQLLPANLAPDRDWTYVANLDGDVRTVVADLAMTIETHPPQRSKSSVIAGISLGAHAVAHWAVREKSAYPLLLALPAWTGPPESIAAMTAYSADMIEAMGTQAYLQQIAAQSPSTHGWIVAALQSSWSTFPAADLAASLRRSATSHSPSPNQLASITGPVLIIGLTDDPLHPITNARLWAELIPKAELVELTVAQVSACGSLATPEVEVAWRALVGD